MSSQLSGAHQKMYQQLFQHPLPHNLHWHEVWSMLGAMKDAQAVETYLVPSGATFANDVTGTTPVDETSIFVKPFKAVGKAVKKVVKKMT